MLKKYLVFFLLLPLMTGCSLIVNDTADSVENSVTKQSLETTQTSSTPIFETSQMSQATSSVIESTEIYHGETIEDIKDSSVPAETTSQTSTPAESAQEVILTQSQAVQVVSQQFSDQTDLVYMIWSEDDTNYLVKVMSKPLMEQGASGPLGFYSVNKVTGVLEEVTF